MSVEMGFRAVCVSISFGTNLLNAHPLLWAQWTN